MKHIIYRNNIEYPFKAIIVNDEDIYGKMFSGALVYFNQKNKKFTLAINNECDYTTGGIYAGTLQEVL